MSEHYDFHLEKKKEALIEGIDAKQIILSEINKDDEIKCSTCIYKSRGYDEEPCLECYDFKMNYVNEKECCKE